MYKDTLKKVLVFLIPGFLVLAPFSISFAAPPPLSSPPAAPPVRFGPTHQPPPRHIGAHPWPKPGRVVPTLPMGYVPIFFHGAELFFHLGIFYRAQGHQYIAIQPPTGVVVKSIPANSALYNYDGTQLYYCEGTYYRQVPEGYMVTEQPVNTANYADPDHPLQTVNASPGDSLQVTVPFLNVRTGPGLTHQVTEQVTLGTSLLVVGFSDNWYYVSLPSGKTGWVAREYTKFQAVEPKG